MTGGHDHLETGPDTPRSGFGPEELEHRSWEVAATRLRLRLRQAGPDVYGSNLGGGLCAQLVLELDQVLIPVRSSSVSAWAKPMSTVVHVAEINTMAQPLQWRTTSVISGADAGATLIIVGGGPCTSGLVAGLGAYRSKDLSLPALISVPNDCLVIIGAIEAPRPSPAWSALAHRLRALRPPPAPVFQRQIPPHRNILRCHKGGRLTMFEAEDS